jgi:hypothetical protein
MEAIGRLILLVILLGMLRGAKLLVRAEQYRIGGGTQWRGYLLGRDRYTPEGQHYRRRGLQWLVASEMFLALNWAFVWAHHYLPSLRAGENPERAVMHLLLILGSVVFMIGIEVPSLLGGKHVRDPRVRWRWLLPPADAFTPEGARYRTIAVWGVTGGGLLLAASILLWLTL